MKPSPRRGCMAAMRKPAARVKSFAVAPAGIGGLWMAFKILCLRFSVYASNYAGMRTGRDS